MSKSNLSTLAETIGVVRAAQHVLNADSLSVEQEAFLREHYHQLSAEYLLCWLGHDDPCETESERPNTRIVERVVGQLGETGGLLLTADPRLLEAVHDDNVRDEIIERLRSALGDDIWWNLALLAEGGSTFRAVRDLERALHRGGLQHPLQLIDEGPVPSLVPILFADRRDEAACKRRLCEATRDPRLRLYTLWALQRSGLLASVGTLDALLGEVPAMPEVDLHAWPRISFQLGVARAWPDVEARKEWVTRRALDAVNRGVSWGALWWEIPPDLRDEVALASLPTGDPAPWIMGAVVRRLSGRERWRTVFDLLGADQVPNLAAGAGVLAVARGLRLFPGLEPRAEEIAAASKEFEPCSWDAWLELPLPEDADDLFEEQFVRATLHRGPDFVIGRLLTLPLTKNRASRILELALDHHKLWEIDRLQEIAALAGPVDRVVPLPPSGEWMNTYKVLVGPSAGDTFQRAIDRAIEREHLDEAARIARLAPDLVSPDQRSALQSLTRSLSVSALAAVQAEHPWLLSPSDVVAEATTPDRSWGIPDRLPGYLMPVMEAKAAATEDAGLATKLLDRLEELGAPRRKILGVALERLARDPTAVPAGWFSHRLDSKALWEDVGTETLTALLREPTTDRATVVYEVCHGALRTGADLCATMHTVLGRVLVRFAKEALTQGDTGKARTALTALAHLSPAPRIRQTVLALRKVGPHLDDEVEHLIELNAGLLRRGTDLATLSDIAHALAALCGGQGGDP